MFRRRGEAGPRPGLGRFGVCFTALGNWVVDGAHQQEAASLEWLKIAEIPPSGGRDATLRGRASQENNGATEAAQPCSEMRPAPHCLPGKVRKPSLEFKRHHNRPRLNLPGLISAPTSCPDQAQRLPEPPSWSSFSLGLPGAPDSYQSSF